MALSSLFLTPHEKEGGDPTETKEKEGKKPARGRNLFNCCYPSSVSWKGRISAKKPKKRGKKDRRLPKKKKERREAGTTTSASILAFLSPPCTGEFCARSAEGEGEKKPLGRSKHLPRKGRGQKQKRKERKEKKLVAAATLICRPLYNSLRLYKARGKNQK